MRRHANRAVACIATGAVLGAMLGAACTVFDDVPLPSDPDGASPRPEAAPGIEASPAADAGPIGFVEEDRAVVACAAIAACPLLETSFAVSLRIPVAEPTYIVFSPAPVRGAPTQPNFSYCVEYLSRDFEPKRPGRNIAATVIEQIARATSCRQAGTYLGVDFLPAPDPRCDAGAEAGAEGGADAGAEAGPPVCGDLKTELNCALNGDTIPALSHCDAPPHLTSDTCSNDLSRGCDLADGDCPICQGSVAIECGKDLQGVRQPFRRHIDCNALGLICAFAANGADAAADKRVGCASAENGRIIEPSFPGYRGAYCSDAKKLFITSGTHASEVDCSERGEKCKDGPGGAVCSAPDAECTPFMAEANVCRGSKIHLCLGGRWKDVECPHGCADAPDASTHRSACKPAFDASTQ